MPKRDIFVITPELHDVLDSLPDDEPRSRLEPFRTFIMRWRREGRSYETIRLILQDKCQVRTTKSTIFEFVERRSRKIKHNRALQIEESIPPQLQEEQETSSAQKLTAEQRTAQVDFIRSLNQPTLEEQPKSGWNFDLDKPRTIQKR